LGLALRLYGLHNPILDHPGWRQGDTAAIARNFATLRFDIFYPQTDYDGPSDNYVELELQIVPFLAAIGYKLFGVHEVFGRLISIAFSLGTVAVLYWFGSFLFGSRAAGAGAALAFAIFPGSIYYGRTFTPDTTMIFFLTAALYASAKWIRDAGVGSWKGWGPAALLMSAAILAKPVAALGLVPVAVLLFRRGGPGAATRLQPWAFLVVALLPYLAYDRYVGAHAEWHWASGIMRLHVLPQLRDSFVSASALGLKLRAFLNALAMLAHTMLGPIGFALTFAGTIVLLASRPAEYDDRHRFAVDYLVAWLLAGLAYAYVVVTVERVDYYLYPLVPLGALLSSYAVVEGVKRYAPRPTRSLAAVGAVALLGTIAVDVWQIRPYYFYSKANYRAARALDAALPAGAIVVMAHYDPSILYYINRKGWEEDPLLWTPFDEESAINKGARYFIAIENKRFERNAELYAWMQRFPVEHPEPLWPVYHTDPARTLPGAEERWQEFRRKEKR
jgi:4-amino-4-deoxy-L-arabinose transferase-like glycosyltransferase